MAKHAINRICVDSIHGTTSHDFQFTTLLTVDKFGAGCPVAFYVSNGIDSVALSKFFICKIESGFNFNQNTYV